MSCAIARQECYTHTVDAVDEGVVAGVAHRQPVEHEEHDVDVLPPEHSRTSSVHIFTAIAKLETFGRRCFKIDNVSPAANGFISDYT